jgi:nucleoside-diphosphate-sugar epimerase
VLRDGGCDATGIDVRASPYTTVVGSVADRAVVRDCLAGADAVLHTATLHKPHVGSHGKQAFVDANVTGTLTLLEEAVAAGVSGFVFTSTTSAFGRAQYIVSATTPFTPADLAALRDDAPAVVRRLFPDYEAEYARRDWRMFPSIGRVYVNARARADLGWSPRYDFRSVLDALKVGEDPSSTERKS